MFPHLQVVSRVLAARCPMDSSERANVDRILVLSAGPNSTSIEAQRTCCAIAMISSLRIHLHLVTPSKWDTSLSLSLARWPIRWKVKKSKGQGGEAENLSQFYCQHRPASGLSRRSGVSLDSILLSDCSSLEQHFHRAYYLRC